jgi:hypothetical protein
MGWLDSRKRSGSPLDSLGSIVELGGSPFGVFIAELDAYVRRTGEMPTGAVVGGIMYVDLTYNFGIPLSEWIKVAGIRIEVADIGDNIFFTAG